mmetsp:Transcript_14783/g.21120  ORF Transcript_14783/g.21120 Transcript_14783/m.21120 type:complete len:449 (+) Transcript_14783:61-1407(+)
MTDPFRQFFLDTVNDLIQKNPNADSLLNLLKIVSPSITSENIFNSLSSRGNPDSGSDVTLKAFKLLKLRIHPDKHPTDARVTQLFQDVQIFYDSCFSSKIVSSAACNEDFSPRNNCNSRKRPRTSHTNSEMAVKYPESFDILSKYPYVCLQNPKPPLKADKNLSITSKNLAPMLAYKCINARGALAHGKKITSGFSWRDVEKRVNQHTDCTVKQIFDFHGGTKQLTTVQEIKDELVNRGPVISVSFSVVEEYIKQFKVSESSIDSMQSHKSDKGEMCQLYGDLFLQERIGNVQEMMIVGWTLTMFGESWLIQPLTNYDDNIKSCTSPQSCSFVPIGVNQFGINDLCLSPKSSFENLPWQPGPYFDSDFKDAPEWRLWKEMDLPLSSCEFQTLAKCFGEKGLIHAALSEKGFVIRDKKRLAHSETYSLKEVRWDENTKEWVATVHLIPS